MLPFQRLLHQRTPHLQPHSDLAVSHIRHPGVCRGRLEWNNDFPPPPFYPPPTSASLIGGDLAIVQRRTLAQTAVTSPIRDDDASVGSIQSFPRCGEEKTTRFSPQKAALSGSQRGRFKWKWLLRCSRWNWTVTNAVEWMRNVFLHLSSPPWGQRDYLTDIVMGGGKL